MEGTKGSRDAGCPPVSLLKAFSQAAEAITVNCGRATPAERHKALDFLSKASGTPAVAHTLGDSLRRFGHLLTPQEKLKMAELLDNSDAMPPLTRRYVRSSLENAIQKEVSWEVVEAFRRLYHKICE